MVTFLITSVLILGLFAIAVYFWQKPANKAETIELPPSHPPAALFSDTPADAESTATDDRSRAELLERADRGDLTVLAEVNSSDNIYRELLTAVVSSAPTEDKLLAVASFVARRNLPANQSLMDVTTRAWEISPDRQTTSQMLHLAALTNDAEVYDTAVKQALTSWRQRDLLNVSASELNALINSEYWVLSTETRSSGRGFVLKLTLSNARRELEAATTK
jgi:hypothetical protein